MVEEDEQVRSGGSVVTAARAHAPFNKAERLGARGCLWRSCALPEILAVLKARALCSRMCIVLKVRKCLTESQ